MAASIFPEIKKSFMMFMKFESTRDAFLIVRNLSIEKYSARTDNIPIGIIIHPPFIIKVRNESGSCVWPAGVSVEAIAAVVSLSESALILI